MKRRGSRRLRPLATVVVVALGLLLAGCAEKAPYDSLEPEGPFARDPDRLFKPVFWIAVAVFVIVEGLIFFAVFRFRQRTGEERPRQVHGNFRLEVTLTALPLMVLLGISVPTVATIFDLAERPKGAPVTVDVIGHQFWWEYQYQGEEVVTATELHIPVDEPVFLRLTSEDVIHSFWIPKLAGKRDVIPGRLQTMKIQADEPGVYLGKCAEFCGDSHANMRARAVAQTRADFDRWLADQRRAADEPATGTAAADGLGLFTSKGCAGCHTVEGVSQGQIGPDLTHLMSRTTFAGGIFRNDAQNLAAWLRDPPGEKPGSLMPDLELTEDEIRDLVAYLETLT